MCQHSDSEKTADLAKDKVLNVTLDQFEGPLDMLLHLVRDAKLDITEISLAKVAQQFYMYLEIMKRNQIEIDSSYLVVLAQLLELKSRLLLPFEEMPKEQGLLDYYDDELEIDGDAPLVDRLAAYAAVKDAAFWLAGQEAKSFENFPRPIAETCKGEPLLELSVTSLVNAFKRLESSPRAYRKPVVLRKVVLSVPERISQLWQIFLTKPVVKFSELIGENPGKDMIIVTFLALLEMTFLKKITVTQHTPLGDIELQRRTINAN